VITVKNNASLPFVFSKLDHRIVRERVAEPDYGCFPESDFYFPVSSADSLVFVGPMSQVTVDIADGGCKYSSGDKVQLVVKDAAALARAHHFLLPEEHDGKPLTHQELKGTFLVR
jgi:hypothetical protein